MFKESELYEAFGLEEPKEEGQKEQEVTAPAASAAQQQNDEEGVQEQEIAEPAGDENNSASVQPEKSGEKKEMSAEERHKFAEERRQKELAQLRAEAKEAAMKEVNEQIKKLYAGKKNPYTGEEISGIEDLQSMSSAEQTARLTRDLKAGKLTQEALSAAVQNVPEIQRVQELLKNAEADAQAAKAAKEAAQQEQFRKQADAELAEIEKLNPKVKTLNDILAMPSGQRFAKYVRENGLSFLDAYKLANAEDIAKTQSAAAVQMQKNSVSGKDHLYATKTVGDGAIIVPDDVKSEYRMFNPDATDEEIAKHYQSFAKTQK